MEPFEITLHWIYVAVMFGSAAIFLILSRDGKDVPLYKYLIHTFIVIWSGLAYASLALGQGSAESAGNVVYYPRYIDWVVTTPLLLLSLNLTGKFNIKLEGSLTAALMGTQVIMIITGLVAELSPDDIKWFWYTAGCVALLAVLYLIWGPLKRKSKLQGQEIEQVYHKSAVFLSIQWLAYPLVWAIGYMGAGLIDKPTTTFLFILLPIVSKAGFGFYNLFLLRSLPASVKQQHANKDEF